MLQWLLHDFSAAEKYKFDIGRRPSIRLCIQLIIQTFLLFSRFTPFPHPPPPALSTTSRYINDQLLLLPELKLIFPTEKKTSRAPPFPSNAPILFHEINIKIFELILWFVRKEIEFFDMNKGRKSLWIESKQQKSTHKHIPVWVGRQHPSERYNLSMRWWGWQWMLYRSLL